MQPQETKFSFIYHELTQRILDGQILPGHCLPSSRMLCEQFRVSRYTINRVLDALQSDGLIEIQPGWRQWFQRQAIRRTHLTPFWRF